VEGRKEECRSMVISLLRMGVAIEQVAQAVGISIEAVTQLQQENQL
jgi:predicted transposase YdaD